MSTSVVANLQAIVQVYLAGLKYTDIFFLFRNGREKLVRLRKLLLLLPGQLLILEGTQFMSPIYCYNIANTEGLLCIACSEERESVDWPERVDLSTLSLSSRQASQSSSPCPYTQQLQGAPCKARQIVIGAAVRCM